MRGVFSLCVQVTAAVTGRARRHIADAALILSLCFREPWDVHRVLNAPRIDVGGISQELSILWSNPIIFKKSVIYFQQRREGANFATSGRKVGFMNTAIILR